MGDLRLAEVARHVLAGRLSLADYRRLRRSMPVTEAYPPGAWDPDPPPAPTIACHPDLFGMHAASERHRREPDGSWVCIACHPSCADCGAPDVHHWWSGIDLCAACWETRKTIIPTEEEARA